MATFSVVNNLRWSLFQLDGANANLIEAVKGDDNDCLLLQLSAFKEALSAVQSAVSLLTAAERSHLERAASAGWFDRLKLQTAAMTRWCRNELGSPDNVCLELLRRNAMTYRAGHSLEQIDAFRRMDTELSVTFSGSKLESPNEWVRRRKELKETVEDQMMVLYKKDKRRTVAMESPEIAQILGCSEQAVRKKSNKVWQMLQAENEANMQRLTRRHTSDKTDDIDDE